MDRDVDAGTGEIEASFVSERVLSFRKLRSFEDVLLVGRGR